MRSSSKVTIALFIRPIHRPYTCYMILGFSMHKWGKGGRHSPRGLVCSNLWCSINRLWLWLGYSDIVPTGNVYSSLAFFPLSVSKPYISVMIRFGPIDHEHVAIDQILAHVSYWHATVEYFGSSTWISQSLWLDLIGHIFVWWCGGVKILWFHVEVFHGWSLFYLPIWKCFS